MNKQESALELTERDIENAFIQQENAAVARELSESDEWVNGDAIYVDHEFEGYLVGKSRNGWLVVEDPDKPDYTNVNPDMAIKGLSPDQLAAKERYDWVENVCEEVGISDDFIVYQMYDAGYRK